MNPLRRCSLLALHFLRCALGMLLAGAAAGVFAQAASGSFDHLKTGFALTGTHVVQRCESCHQLGVFKGTPRDCASCHTAGTRLSRANVVKPNKHIPTQQTCDTCHNTQAFTGAKFSHAGVAVGACLTCHAAGLATGKTPGHLVTSASCDTCHRVAAWRPASGFNHAGVAAGTCATCHGVTAKGKTALHIPTIVPTSMPSCDTCHRSGYTAFAPARLHASVAVSASCVTCHTGGFTRAVGKPNTPVHANVTVCESCHKSTASWAGARVDHSTYTMLTNCAGCHNGTSATGRSATTHIPAGTTNCLSCHTTTAWRPSSWNHTQLVPLPGCSTCHSGAFPPADARHATHVPYDRVTGLVAPNCDTCHKSGVTSWTLARVHSSVTVPAASCASCHTGGFLPAVGKSQTHPPTPIGAACDTCHLSTSSWATAPKPNHSTFTATTTCATAGCHSVALKAPTHVPTGSMSVTCGSCHTTLSWRLAPWNHSQAALVGGCSTCHTGGFPPADGRPVTHVPYAALGGLVANCDACHKGGTGAWITNARVHANVTTIATGCATCHTGQFQRATGKSPTHVATTAACETCHTGTTTWLGARINHSTFTAATNCAGCHGVSANAVGKAATHIPVGTTNCFACHGTATWLPTKWNHTQVPVAARCSTCHTGAFPPADGRRTNHIPYQLVTAAASANCDTCHVVSTSWVGARFHSKVGVTTQCSTCHTGAFPPAGPKGTSALHTNITSNCESCHRSTASWAAATTAHTAATAVGTGTCDTCHGVGGSATSKAKPIHVPVPAGTAKCDSCHRSQVSWATAVTMNHAVVTTATCKSCHDGRFLTQGVVGALAKPTNHIPEQLQLLNGAAMDCKACHTGTTVWTTVRMNHNASLGNGSGWCKGCHTSGQTFLGSMEKKSLNHERSGSTDCSQSGCHRPLGTRGSAYGSW
jgi:hypothetical protein